MRGFVGALCAIGCGALVGTLIALSIDPHGYGWWTIGALMGGATAYAVYDIKTAWRALKTVFKSIPRYADKGISETYKMFISADFYKLWSAMVLFCLSLLSVALVLSAGLGMYIYGITKLGLGVNQTTGSILVWVVAFIFVGSGFFSVMEYSYYLRPQRRHEFMVGRTTSYLTMAKVMNPIMVFLYYLPRLIWWFCKLGAKLIKLIHSDTRALCFLYASTGATVGYFVGHGTGGFVHLAAPLIGAAAGMGLAFIVHAVLPRHVTTPASVD